MKYLIKITSLAVSIIVVTSLSVFFAPQSRAHTWDAPDTADLIAGQHTVVGRVEIWNDNTHLYVRYITENDWYLAETHLHVVENNENLIPQTNSGNPIPGQFENKRYYEPVSTQMDTYLYNLAGKGFEVGDKLVIAAHAVVQEWPYTEERGYYMTEEETAWKDGTEFPYEGKGKAKGGGNWGMYNEYTVQHAYPDISIAEYYIGYEDRERADFDYNDFGMDVSIEEDYGDADGYLDNIWMKFEARRKDADDNHDIHIWRLFPATMNYDYTVARINGSADGNEVEAGNYSGIGIFDNIIFDSQYFDDDEVVTIFIENFDENLLFPYPASSSSRWDTAANENLFAFYDPWLNNRAPGVEGERHISQWMESQWSTDNLVPWILVVPYKNWPAPMESVYIVDNYPAFDNYYRDMTPEDWYIPGKYTD